jgi:hypothetical protein
VLTTIFSLSISSLTSMTGTAITTGSAAPGVLEDSEVRACGSSFTPAGDERVVSRHEQAAERVTHG